MSHFRWWSKTHRKPSLQVVGIVFLDTFHEVALEVEAEVADGTPAWAVPGGGAVVVVHSDVAEVHSAVVVVHGAAGAPHSVVVVVEAEHDAAVEREAAEVVLEDGTVAGADSLEWMEADHVSELLAASFAAGAVVDHFLDCCFLRSADHLVWKCHARTHCLRTHD